MVKPSNNYVYDTRTFFRLILNRPRHPVTVNVIGAGGTGSQVITSLARMDLALRRLGHPGLFVRVYDPDRVSESNIGRQLFSEADLGLNKAQCLITRINRFFGNDWTAIPQYYPQKKDNLFANLFITCTDSKNSRNYSKRTGQTIAIRTTIHLCTGQITEMPKKRVRSL